MHEWLAFSDLGALAPGHHFAAGALAVVLVQCVIVAGKGFLAWWRVSGQLEFPPDNPNRIWAEALDDVAVRPVPLLEGEAQAMVDQLRCRPWLDGLRGSPPLDIAGLIQAIERLAALGAMLGPKLRSLDINPLFVLPDGVLAADALVVPS